MAPPAGVPGLRSSGAAVEGGLVPAAGGALRRVQAQESKGLPAAPHPISILLSPRAAPPVIHPSSPVGSQTSTSLEPDRGSVLLEHMTDGARCKSCQMLIERACRSQHGVFFTAGCRCQGSRSLHVPNPSSSRRRVKGYLSGGPRRHQWLPGAGRKRRME